MNAERLTRLLEPVVSQVGLELDRVDVVPAGRRRLVRVTIDGDGPDGHGPSLDEISEATAEISHCLDDSGAMGESPYTLEVSSRGVSTPSPSRAIIDATSGTWCGSPSIRPRGRSPERPLTVVSLRLARRS